MSPHTLSFLNSIRVRFIQPFKSGAYLFSPWFHAHDGNVFIAFLI